MASTSEVQCPVCLKFYKSSGINDHIDECLTTNAESTDQDVIIEKSENRIINRKRKSDSPDSSGWGFLKASNSFDNVPSSKKNKFQINKRTESGFKKPHNLVEKTNVVNITDESEKNGSLEMTDSAKINASAKKKLPLFSSNPDRNGDQEQPVQTNIDPFKPLAEQMRPTCFEDYIGHDKEVGEQTMLGSLLQNDKIPSMVLWGPPGCGKVILG